MLGYQEEHGDWCMTLDVPTEAIDEGNIYYPTFKSCLDQTLKYLTYYRDNRRSSSEVKGFLNVLQGRSRDECDVWYNAIKDFPFQGWAFAGKLRKGFGLVLERLIQMRDENKLADKKWIHFLGMGEPSVAVLLTAIQDGLRESGIDITVTFDNSTTSRQIAQNKLGGASATLTKREFQLNMIKLPDHVDYIGRSDLPFPFVNSPIGARLTMADICSEDKRGRTKSGNHEKSTWSSPLSTLLLSNHCTYVGVATAIEAAARSRLFMEDAMEFAPMPLLQHREHIIQILTSKEPGRLLENYGDALNSFSGEHEDRFKAGWAPL